MVVFKLPTLLDFDVCLVGFIFGSDFTNTLYFALPACLNKVTVLALRLPLPCHSALGSPPVCTEVHYAGAHV